jgi:membrane-associated phospholipid phosphatase
MSLFHKAAAAVALAAVTSLATASEAIAAEFEEDRSSSVYRISPLVDGVVIAVGALGGGLPYLWRESIIEQDCPCDRNQVNAFDRPAIGNDSTFFTHASSVSLGLALAVPLVLDYLVLDDRWVWLEDAVVFTEAVMINIALTTAVKFSVQRPQPTVYDPDGPGNINDPLKYLSFYSGHTSVVFAALSTTSFTAGKRYGIWALPYIVTVVYGAGVGTQLVLSGGHFPTDVIVGAAAGTLVGTVVPWLHLRSEDRLSLLPWGLTGGAGIAVRGLL